MSDLPTAFLDLLKALIRIPSVVGSEHAFFAALKRELDERGAIVSWYDGLLVAEGGDPAGQIFTAHVDRHGLVCTGPNEFQYAAFVAGRRSDLLGNSVSEKLMSKIVDRFSGLRVVAYEPWSGAYLGTGGITSAYICELRKNLIFEIAGLENLLPGTPVAFMDRLALTDGTIRAQLDNVLSVAHLVYLFEIGFKGTVLFSAQEESGSSWRYLVEWFRRHHERIENLIVVDTSPFLDFEAAQAQDVVLRTRDANALFQPEATRRLEALCRSESIRYIYKDRAITKTNEGLNEAGKELQSLGSTELGRLIRATGGFISGTTLQIPTIGYHTMEETATIRSNTSFQQILKSIANL